MKIFIITAVICLLAQQTLGDSVSVYSCTGNYKLRIDSLTMEPLPIEFPSLMEGNIRGAITQRVSGNFRVQVKMFYKADFGLFTTWIKFPMCISGFGSCTIEDGCQLLPPNCGLPSCECPVPPGQFNIDLTGITIPALPKVLQWAARRDYRFEFRGYENGEIVTCHKVYIHLDQVD